LGIRTEFPRRVREIEHTWIRLADGTRLAARIWLPDDAEDEPVPAILEYLPYRKNDGTAVRDAARQPYLAGFGYATVRVDIRGTGESDGILEDEYLPREQDDALEVIAWLAEQSWCTGAVGMWGISWGGFNSLQVAARRPPALGAIVTLCSTDDRYADDVHYRGGCVLALDMVHWASSMLTAFRDWIALSSVTSRKIFLEAASRSRPSLSVSTSNTRVSASVPASSACSFNSAASASETSSRFRSALDTL
jgi:uncharacterized protein